MRRHKCGSTIHHSDAPGGRGVPTLVGALIAGIILCLLAFSPAAAHARAGGNGSISGQLLDGTTNNSPLAGQTVTLQAAQGANSQDLATAKTDAHGDFAFPHLSTDKTVNYAVYINYKGAQYVSNVVTLDSKPAQTLNLTVYEPTSDSSKIAIVQATVLLHEPDAHRGLLTVSEFFSFQNLDMHTFVGSLDASKGKPRALFFSLPQGARNVALGQSFNGYNTIQVDSGFASNAAVLPGNNEFSFSFEIPYSNPVYDFRYVTMYPTVSLSFMAPSDMHASSATLASQGIITADQHPYHLFKASTVLANQEMHVQLEGLPMPAPATPPSLVNTGNAWLIVILLLMAAIVAATWLFYRARVRRITARKSGKQSGKSAAKAPAPSTPEGRRKGLLQELRDLDKAFEAGKLSKSAYQERRAKTKARLRSLMSEEEAARR